MTINLDSYPVLQSNLFVKIECPYYKTSEGATPVAYDFLFSDRINSYTLEGDTYSGLGHLMSITTSGSELRTSSSELTITISGIPNSSISEIINSRIKGSKVTIYRAVFDANTGSLISISGNPMTRFIGYINNLALNEDYNFDSRTSSSTIALACASVVDILDKKISGRKTNSSSMKKYYPSDVSMDRVTALESSYFDFGAK